MAKEGIQINKYISNTGYCSRRDADKLVAMGRVMINENIAIPTSKVAAGDKVYVDDELLKKKELITGLDINTYLHLTGCTK